MPPPNSLLPEWHRAFGAPVLNGHIKQKPEDFQVVEQLGFTLSGDGEHDFLWVEKMGANTTWVARALAKHADVAIRDVGFSGLKDRQAVTQQWFSVRRPGGGGTDWSGFAANGVRIISATRHLRKLKRGAHSSNKFRIAVRSDQVAGPDVERRLKDITERGVPNYFGEQRFGRNGNNMALATSLFAGKRLQREQRSIVLSAARSFLFNEILSARVANESWDQAIPGDVLNLDGSGSVFVPECIDESIQERIALLDVHPTGALWGSGDLSTNGDPAVLEQTIADAHPKFTAGLLKAGLKMARRPLRLAAIDLRWEIDDPLLWLEFSLGRGSYATSVLREVLG